MTIIKTLRPSGPSVSLLGNCQSGLEPHFAGHYLRQISCADIISFTTAVNPPVVSLTAGFQIMLPSAKESGSSTEATKKSPT